MPVATSVHHFVRSLLVLVLSPPRRAVLVLETRWDSNSVHWSVSFRKWLRSTIGIAAVQTAIEYEYRFTEYEYRFTEYEEIRCGCANR